jgi:HEAT repeat protein
MNTFHQDIQHIDELIDTHKGRLRDLELQQATKGLNTPPEINYEIRKINTEIENLYKRKSELLKKEITVNYQEKDNNRSTVEKSSNNNENILIDAILDSDCVLFLGSMLSRSTSNKDLPFHMLLKRNLASNLNLCRCEYFGGQEECEGLTCCCHWSLQRFILYCLSISKEKLIDTVEDTIKSIDQITGIHRIISRVHKHFVAIITTNYDDIIEKSLNKIKTAIVFDDNDLHDTESRLPIIKMRGSITQPQLIRIIDTFEDKEERVASFIETFFERNTIIKQRIQKKTLLFIGHDLHDEIFHKIIQGINKSFDVTPILFVLQKDTDEFEKIFWSNQQVGLIDKDPESFLLFVENRLSNELMRLYNMVRELSNVFTSDQEIFYKGYDFIPKTDLESVISNLQNLLKDYEFTEFMRKVILLSDFHLNRMRSTWEQTLFENDDNLESFIIDVLQRGSSPAKEQAAILALNYGMIHTVDILLDLLINHDQINVRRVASKALASLGHEKTAYTLLDHYTEHLCLETFLSMPISISIPTFVGWYNNRINEQPNNITQSSSLFRKNQSKLYIVEGVFLPMAISVLNQTDELVFNITLKLLAFLQQDAAADCLANFIRQSSDNVRRSEALHTLASMYISHAIYLIGQFIKDEFIGDEALRLLQELTQHSEPYIRQSAIQRIVRLMSGEESFGLLYGNLTNPSTEIRTETLNALNEKISTYEVFDRLIEMELQMNNLSQIFDKQFIPDMLAIYQESYEAKRDHLTKDDQRKYDYILKLIKELDPA